MKCANSWKNGTLDVTEVGVRMGIENNLRKIWAVELDLLEKLKGICNKYGLAYYASSGTLLGAVRHQGFIPWDDDIDVFLMWPDYQKLLRIAPRECSYPYFFQCLYTESEAILSGCRLRRSDTTGFTSWEHENVGPDYDRGLFIDIFPLFQVPDSADGRAKQREAVIDTWYCIHALDAIRQQKRGGPVNSDYVRYIPKLNDICAKKGITDPVSLDALKLREDYLEACAMETSRTREVGATSSYCHRPNLMWNSEWFDRRVELPFENTRIACPADYEKVLEKQYGDWRTPIKGGAVHTMKAVDTEIPWREFDMSSL